MSDAVGILVAIGLLFANAFFVGAEFALVSCRRSAIEPRANDGSRLAKITLGAMEDVSTMMAGAQLGITVCSLGLGYIGEPAVAHVLEGPFGTIGIPDSLQYPIAFAIALGIVVSLHVVIGEMVPKNIALAGPDRTALVLTPLLVLIVRILRPAIAFMNAIANGVLRLLGVEPKDEVASAFTRDEVAGLVEASHREGLLDHHEEQLLLDALQFEDGDARTVLLPLGELRTVPQGVTAEEIERLATRTGFSRFPLRATDGTLTGYLHLKDLLESDASRRATPVDPARVRALPTVNATDGLRSVLSAMQHSGAHLARVVGAEQETLGVVALEDVLEELVGEVRDEVKTSPVRASGVRLAGPGGPPRPIR